MRQTFRIAVLIVCGIELILRAIPSALWNAEGYAELLKFDGYGARLMLIHPVYDWLPLAVFVIAVIGLFAFKNWGRYTFLGLWLLMTLGTLLFGVRVVAPLISFLSIVASTLDGFILYAAFFSPLRVEFAGSQKGKK
jgi:hypothetical protein